MITKLSAYISNGTQVWENQALESFFLNDVREGECILYLWQNQNTVVIGRNQNAWNECAIDDLERSSGTLARRLSGGGAVYHDLGNLNFTFLLHSLDYDVKKQSSVILDAVRALGISAKMSGRNDLIVDGKKFSGHAYYRKGDRSFHHGTIMVEIDTSRLSSFLTVSKPKLEKNSVPSVQSRVVNLRELKPDLTVKCVEEQLISSFSDVYGLPADIFPEARLNRSVIDEERIKFADWDWRYGSRADFPEKTVGRFSWGMVEIGYHVQQGVLKNVVLYSDGMEAELLSEIPIRLEGCRYTPQALLERLMTIEATTSLEKTILQDIGSLF